jgi:hypothetical protein
MKYSIVNGERKEAFPKGNGFCECCNKPTIAKCGSKIMHHWAHKSLEECDNWRYTMPAAARRGLTILGRDTTTTRMMPMAI